jgi:hypothetical protein
MASITLKYFTTDMTVEGINLKYKEYMLSPELTKEQKQEMENECLLILASLLKFTYEIKRQRERERAEGIVREFGEGFCQPCEKQTIATIFEQGKYYFQPLPPKQENEVVQETVIIEEPKKEEVVPKKTRKPRQKKA